MKDGMGLWRGRSHLWLFGMTTFLLFAGLVKPGVQKNEEDIFLKNQAAALRQDFRLDLEGLTDAPRYKLYATVDPEEGTVSGTAEVTYTNQSEDNLEEIVFRLYPNAKTIYGGGSLVVGEPLWNEQILAAQLSDDDTTLRVLLPGPLKPADSLTLELGFTAHIPSRISQGYGIFHQSNRLIALSGWYPVLAAYQENWDTSPIPTVGDALLAETSLYQVEITAPRGYQMVSTGKTIVKQENRNETTWRVVTGPVREYAAALSTQFSIKSTQVGGVMLHSYSLPASSPRNTAEQSIQIMEDAFQTFAERFGPFPFTELDLVEAPVSIGGYEFSGMVFVDDGARLSRSQADYRYLVAHEIAHQWWYGLAGNHTVAEPWIDEAHATYAASLYLEDTFGEEAGDGLVNYWRRSYGLPYRDSPPIDSPALDFNNWASYRQTVYIHGALFLEQLRQTMCDDDFFGFLQEYQETYRYQIASTEDYLNLAESMNEQDLDDLYRDWFSDEAPVEKNSAAGKSLFSS